MPAPALEHDLDGVLKRTFGYDSFRPQQREIIDAALAGKDVFALLPTGGGKSLCFQLPALVREGLTVVVSPLIALMKDQVDQLRAAGVAATFLNSSLDEGEARRRLRGLHQAEYKLLYVAPERLMLDGWAEKLTQWNVTALAIDEAHCVSEWGHDFRPEYRQLSRLRAQLPGVPVMALTATATERVRADIVKQLKLTDCQTFVSSFNRPNLTYRVLVKDQPSKQILEFIRRREDESGIIYCASRAATERVATAISARGHKAVAYHAGLDAAERSSRQEAFLRDDIKIVCATIAFGMGINKPNVRWVIHHDLPKNIEGYYQETGRAGRDGLPGDCILLFSAGDAAKQRHFIDELDNETEKAVALGQLRQILQYAESSGCRRTELLAYFGEFFGVDNCAACDNCLTPRETYDGTVPAQKFLSCLYRIQQASGFKVGMNHVTDILVGSASEKIRRWNHHTLSTYGIGQELDKSGWAAVGRELVRLGYAEISAGEFATLELTTAGLKALLGRIPITLVKPLTMPTVRRSSRSGSRPGSGDEPYDEILFERLRALRKKLADERNVPAYIILGDTSLRAMSRRYPITLAGMESIPGMGEKKKADFGPIFAAEITGHLQEHPQLTFAAAD
jgi:ATP-dependent DNA helicase RecQ